MSLFLNQGTDPDNLRVKSVNPGIAAQIYGGDGVHIGEYRLSMEDFRTLVLYVLTNTNLVGEDDPRAKLVTEVRGARIIEGYSNSIDDDSGKPQRFEIPGFDVSADETDKVPASAADAESSEN